jgi:hypothetical protein
MKPLIMGTVVRVMQPSLMVDAENVTESLLFGSTVPSLLALRVVNTAWNQITRVWMR